MESGAQQKVNDMTHKLDAYFTTEKAIFVSKSGQPLEREFPCVSDINEFVQYIHEVKGLDYHDTILKVGIDGGGGFLKVCLQTMEKSALQKEFNSLVLGILITSYINEGERGF